MRAVLYMDMDLCKFLGLNSPTVSSDPKLIFRVVWSVVNYSLTLLEHFITFSKKGCSTAVKGFHLMYPEAGAYKSPKLAVTKYYHK